MSRSSELSPGELILTPHGHLAWLATSVSGAAPLDGADSPPAPTPAARVPARSRRVTAARPAAKPREPLALLVAIFRAGNRVTAEQLLAWMVARTTIANWLTTGILLRTGERRVYETTPRTIEMVDRAMNRGR